MKHTRRLMILVLVLAMVAWVAGIAQADILAKKDAEDAFDVLQQSVKDEGGPPLKRKEVEDARANLGQISEDVAPLLDLSSDLEEIEQIGTTVKDLLSGLRVVPYVGPVAGSISSVIKDALDMEEILKSKLNYVLVPAKYLDKTASAGTNAMDFTLGLYFIYDERDKVEGWEFPGEYGIGGGMNYSCFETEVEDYKRRMMGDLERVNHYLAEITHPVTGFNTIYDEASKEFSEFEELFKPISDLSDDLSGVQHLSKQISVVLDKKVRFTIDPANFPDYKVSTTIDFVPEEIYDANITKKYSYDFTVDVHFWSHEFKGSVGLDFSVKDALHASVDTIIDDVVDEVFEDIEDAVPSWAEDYVKDALEGLLSGFHTFAEDLKDKADEMVENAEKHWDVDVSVATVLDLMDKGEDAIKDEILTFIPEEYRDEVEKLLDLDKYVQDILDQVGTIDVEFSVREALQAINTLEHKIMGEVADELAWLMNAFGLKKAAQTIQDLAKGNLDPILDKFPAEDFVPGYKEVQNILEDIQAPIKALKHDLDQIIGEDIPTVNRNYYENNDLESLSNGEYKGKCHKDYWI
ncbi:MAG: hypothetical protein U9Q76_02230 [candidate division WOR-3 bacterium]|nr:hypothetical protein [candidate division WOR-3 bacterium]